MSINIGVNIQRSPNRINQALREAGVNGQYPKLLFDFDDEYYLTNGSSKTFANAMTFARAGLATMVDSDGKIKWAPHNLLTYSEDFTNPVWTKVNTTVSANATIAPDGTTTADNISYSSGTSSDFLRFAAFSHDIGAQYTFKFWVKSVSGEASGTIDQGNLTNTAFTATSEWQLVSHTATFSANNWWDIQLNASGTIAIWGAHLYRSDLGGMVNNPDRGDSYVPTTSSAVYLPRRGHHKYNGDQWVNKGILVESEARTNVFNYSKDFDDIYWTKSFVTLSASDVTAPDGSSDGFKLVEDTTTNARHVSRGGGALANSTEYTASVYLRKGTRTKAKINVYTGAASHLVNFDLVGGTVYSITGATSASIESVGNDWYRCSVTTTTAATGVPNMAFGPLPDDYSTVYTGNGSYIYAWGAQLESASTPSSYIPTNGASVTRAAETVTVPYANLPWPTPTYIGDELVVSQTWVTPVGYDNISTGTGSSVDVTAGTTDSRTALVISGLTVGKVYRVAGTLIESVGAVGFYVREGTTAGNGTILGSSGNLNQGESGEIIFVATSTAANILFARGAAEDFAVDGVSFREINPLSVSIAMMGEMDYADEDTSLQAFFVRWYADGSNYIEERLSTFRTRTGAYLTRQGASGVSDQVESGATYYYPAINVPFNIAARHGSTFINGAVDGIALTADTTPVALPDLSTTNLNLAYDFNGTISEFRIWDKDIQDAGLEAATAPSLEPSLSLTFDGQPSSFTNTGLTS